MSWIRLGFSRPRLILLSTFVLISLLPGPVSSQEFPPDEAGAVADQLAAEGFIAIAPDLLSGKGPGGGGTESVGRQGAVSLIRGLDPSEVTRRLKGAAAYGTALPAAASSVGIVGFCWGGSTSFRMATREAWPRTVAFFREYLGE